MKACFCLYFISCFHISAIAARPNILFIVVDDLGWNDVGFRSSEIRTPNIDRLAFDGLILNEYYVHTVCSPSRATFMTGRYATHHSVDDAIALEVPYGLPLNETTLAEKMIQAGYATHCVGKWHLGFYRWEYTPTFRGFESFLGFYYGGEGYYDHLAQGLYDMHRASGVNCGMGCSKVAWDVKGEYSTKLFTEEAIKIIERHRFYEDRPFFIYLSYQAVHFPPEVPEEYVIPFIHHIPDSKRRVFAGMLSALDEGIGNLTQTLKRNGIMDSTLIIFTSDNGGPTTTGDNVGSRNWPLRGGKHSIYEGGTRVIGFISGYRDRIKPGVYKGLMHGADWLPTLAKVAGYTLFDTLPLDGVSHWDAITGKSSATAVRTEIVYGVSTWKIGFGIRNDVESRKWKLLFPSGGKPQTWCNSTADKPICAYSEKAMQKCLAGACLYRLDKDPYELIDVATLKENSQIFQQMKEKAEILLQMSSQIMADSKCSPFHGIRKAVLPWCSNRNGMTLQSV